MACLVEEDLAAGDGDVEEEVEVGDGAVPPRRLPLGRRCRRRRRRLPPAPAITSLHRGRGRSLAVSSAGGSNGRSPRSVAVLAWWLGL